MATKITVTEGDSILTLLEKYYGTKRTMTKLMKAAKKIGCVLDFKTGKVVKA